LPQQEPGPKHPEACPGLDPQQPVSFGPGILELVCCPVREDVGDISFFKSFEPQLGHSGSVLENTSISEILLQFLQKYS